MTTKQFNDLHAKSQGWVRETFLTIGASQKQHTQTRKTLHIMRRFSSNKDQANTHLRENEVLLLFKDLKHM